MTDRVDYLVIGAGIAGVSAAAALATYGSVLILEAEAQPGYHATGRSAAYFAPSYGNAVVRALTAASEAFYRTPPQGFSDAPLLRPRDALFIARHDQADSLAAMHAELPTLRYLSGSAARTIVPVLDAAYVDAALLDAGGGDLDVDAILQGFLRACRRGGGELRTGSQVTALHRDGDGWLVETSTGRYAARVVINAGGAWADAVAALAGIPAIGIQPKRRTAMLIDPPSGMASSNWPLVIDVDEDFYFKPDAGRLLVSPADETPSEPCDAQPEELDIAVGLDHYLRATGQDVRRVAHRWAGLRSFASDGTFVVGFEPASSGFFWLAGQGGYGVQTAPAMAQLAADLVRGVQPQWLPADVAGAVSPSRFR
ncbi:MAG: FAD-binding oxidoreductase [Pseudomonadales bacterium]|nr:FAD-binding oxidoreductase [Pseudomonadales bacterium]